MSKNIKRNFENYIFIFCYNNFLWKENSVISYSIDKIVRII